MSRPSNTAFHNLCNTSIPASVRSVLGLGLKFIPSPRHSGGANDFQLDRFRRDLLLYNFFSGSPASDREYIPGLYIRSNWTPDNISIEFRARISDFERQIKKSSIRHKIPPNLHPFQQAGLRFLKARPDLHVWESDKNLGPVLSSKTLYIKRVFEDHLNDSTTYRELTQQTAHNRITAVKRIVNKFIQDHHTTATTTSGGHHKTTNIGKFLANSLETKDPFAYFYILAKLHKNPWKTRPITSVAGSILHGLGKWIDFELQKIIIHLKYVCKSSRVLVNTLRSLPPLSQGCLLATADAQSMYTNIDTKHALDEIKEFFQSDEFLSFELNLDTSAILQGLNILMRHSIFKFNQRYFVQLTGTAMGTPPAPPYATLYFYLHERKTISKYQDQLLFYNRYIDDAFFIWDNSTPLSNQKWEELQKDFDSFGKLRWDFSPLSKTVNFLDININIRNNRLHTTLYEKELNLYLYIPSFSYHPPGMLKSIIYGAANRAISLCSDPSDALNYMTALLLRLKQRGYNQQTVISLMNNALNLFNNTSATPHRLRKTSSTNDEKLLLLHKIFCIKTDNKKIRRIFSDTILNPKSEPPLISLRNPSGNKLDACRLIICNHRLRNLRELLCTRKFSYVTPMTQNSL